MIDCFLFDWLFFPEVSIFRWERHIRWITDRFQKLQLGPFEEVEEEEDGLCDEERALKPLVPAGVMICDETGAAGFWANSVPAQ